MRSSSVAAIFLVAFLATVAKNKYCASARIQAAAILPHGDFAIDPELLPAASDAREAADAVADAAHSAANLWLNHHIDPDLVLLTTPHGIALSNDFGIYLGSTGSGTVQLGKDLHNESSSDVDIRNRTVRLDTILLEPKLSQQLVGVLRSRSQTGNVSGIFIPDDSEDMPLHWAEVIPLKMILGEQRQTNRRQRRHMVLSMPLRRFTQKPASSMIQELLELGRAIGSWLESRPERVAVVVSADLSHTHRADGPYGYSDASEPFDRAVGLWASDPCRNGRKLLRYASELQDDALSCGWTGMVILHGMICGEGASTTTATAGSVSTDLTMDWDAQVLANRNATYYGMMVAQFERKRSKYDSGGGRGNVLPKKLKKRIFQQLRPQMVE